MNKLFKIVMASFTLLVSASAFAQWPAGCLPAPQVQGQPPKCYDGRQLNPYTGQWGWPVQAAAPQVQYAPQQYAVPQYAPQPYYGGQPYGMPYGGLPGGLTNCQVYGAIAGGTVGSLAHNHRPQAVILGGLVGGLIGNFICTNREGQRVVVQQAPQPMLQQAAVVQPLPQQVVQPAASGQGVFCNIDGVVTHEVNTAVCVAKAKAKAETLVSGQSVDVKHQERASTCSTGKTWTKLNWPGHPQHDSFVCLPDGDPHRY
jgi:hypothetical protein